MDGIEKDRRAHKFTSTERKWLRLYSMLFQSIGMMSADDAAQYAEQRLRKAISESKASGFYWYPDNLGDIVLSGHEPRDTGLFQIVELLRAVMPIERLDGMTDEDFSEYWNQPDVARGMRIVAMNIPRAAMFVETVETGEYPSLEDAYAAGHARVRLSHARYAHPARDELSTDQYRPLPFEIESRVMKFLMAQTRDIEALDHDIGIAGSVNACY